MLCGFAVLASLWLPATDKACLGIRLDDLLSKLDSADFSVRERAAVEIEKLGRPAVPPLKQLLAAPRSAEVRLRAQRFIELYEGEIAGGLSLFLRADKHVVTPGDTVRLTVRLGNTTNAPVHVPISAYFCSNIFTSGRALRCISTPAGPPGRVLRQLIMGERGPPEKVNRPISDVICCGTGGFDTVVLLPPRETVEFTTAVVLQSGGEYRLAYAGYRLFAPGSGEHRLAVELSWGSPKARVMRRTRDDPRPWLEFDAAEQPVWTGCLRSNAVAITIAREPPPPRR